MSEKKKVLFVDDERRYALCYVNGLREEGVGVTFISDVRDASQHLRQKGQLTRPL
jgi:hypothetical protein